MTDHLIVVRPDGSMAWIAADSLLPLAKACGDFAQRRAAHVEPTADGRHWEARLPCGGLIGTWFERHADAIAAEREAVEELMLQGSTG